MNNYIINEEEINEQEINKEEKNEQEKNEEEINNEEIKLNNKKFLILTSTLFTLFMVSEIVGAHVSNSLSLLGDAIAMSIDVANYVTTIYTENLKEKYNKLPLKIRWNIEVTIPFVGVSSLLAVSIWILNDAIIIITQPQESTNVDVIFLYGYASVNMVIDLICNYSFFRYGVRVFYNLLPKLNTPSNTEDHSNKVQIYNLNMWSAFTHMLGDTIRTIAVLIAALVSTFTNISGDISDAWASIVCTISIFIVVLPLLFHIYKLNIVFYYEYKELNQIPEMPEEINKYKIQNQETDDCSINL
jgi:Co/Zn/Cd efflux system component